MTGILQPPSASSDAGPGESATVGSTGLRIVRVRPGEYLALDDETRWWQDDEALHRARIASASLHIPGAVAVLESAALLHGAQLKVVPDQAHLWVPWRRKATPGRTGCLWSLPRGEREARLAGRPVVNHHMDLDAGDLTELDGTPVTSLAQTTLDCARFLPPDRAFAVVDSLVAIAAGRDSEWRSHRPEVEARARGFAGSLVVRLDGLRGRRGVAQAREILTCATPLSESVWESELRRVALAAGYSEVEPQMEVVTSRGRRWADVGLRRARCCFEANGDVKYSGADGLEVRQAQAQRNVEIAGAGLRVVDLSVPDIRDTAHLLDVFETCMGDMRARTGRRLLWTPSERSRFA